MMWVTLFLTALWAGAQNALAGGGTFITLPALMVAGLDARLANISSTIALFPGQVTTGWVGRTMVGGTDALSFRALVLLSFAGGLVGAALLLSTPSSFFAHLVPWLVLFATALFAWGSFRPKPAAAGSRLSPVAAGVTQFTIAIYGGYFGGGIGFLMLAALSMAGLTVRHAGATKNVLAAVMNASAVVIFVFTPGIDWPKIATVCGGAVLGGYAGALLLRRVDEQVVRIAVVIIGAALTLGLFLKSP